MPQRFLQQASLRELLQRVTPLQWSLKSLQNLKQQSLQNIESVSTFRKGFANFLTFRCVLPPPPLPPTPKRWQWKKGSYGLNNSKNFNDLRVKCTCGQGRYAVGLVSRRSVRGPKRTHTLLEMSRVIPVLCFMVLTEGMT